MDEPAIKALLAAIQQVPFVELPSMEAVSELMLRHQNYTLEDLERFQERPNRIKQKQELLSCDSFCEYVNAFKNDNTVVYLDLGSGAFKAVIDHYGKDDPSWQSHTATFEPTESLQWKAWRGIHKKAKGQIEFAEFIEDSADDIQIPEPNGVLKAAIEFQDTAKLAMTSVQNLDNGAFNFRFTKENVAREVAFPHRITIGIPVYENEPIRQIEARIRYRASPEGVLSFTLSFVTDPDIILRKEIEKLAEKIKQELSGVSLYVGAR